MTTQDLDRIARRMAGADRKGAPVPVKIVPGDSRPVVAGEPAYHTTESGRTIVRYPNAYGYRTWYHHSTERVEVGERWLARLRARLDGRTIVWGDAVLHTDAFAILAPGRRDLAIRFGRDGQRSGVALRVSRLVRREPGWRWGEWEHGRTEAECREEITRKRAILDDEARTKRATIRQERATRLLARIGGRLTATYEDARGAGYCDAGIRSWAEARGIALDSAMPVPALARDSDPRAVRVAIMIARRAVMARAEARS